MLWRCLFFYSYTLEIQYFNIDVISNNYMLKLQDSEYYLNLSYLILILFLQLCACESRRWK